MPRNKAKNWERLDSLMLPDPTGRYFVGPELSDLHNVNIIWSGIDTLRQLYRGKLRPDSLQLLETLAADPGLSDCLTPVRMHIGKAPFGSGYTYKLQNNAWGVTILLKSVYATIDQPGTHLKVELSPQFIAERGAAQIQEITDDIADRFLTAWEPSGVAIHLAADVQGWDLPPDFIDRFITRTRTLRQYKGIDSYSLEDLSSVTAIYGEDGTVTFGKPGALQFTTYRKDHELISSDKLDFMHDQYGKYTLGDFDPSTPVRRFEARFHHSVILQIGEGIGAELTSVVSLVPYLADLWRYALKSNRLDYSTSYIDPFWQILMEDVPFTHPASGITIIRKKKESIASIERNLSQIVGHLISVGARHNWKASFLMRQLYKLPIYNDLLTMYADRGKGESDLFQYVEQGLALRRILGKAA